ncbi:hypothetical protein [Burkholderia arboris]|uniref:hypothetical protein n=1 Tax=Burkholderia arboris TaxID=488730 RepID=UPI001CF41361|nr:hypothetical protein [Burkholderia arboris]MCA8050794.1 hypothetical protein [Burkholderia arboris]
MSLKSRPIVQVVHIELPPRAVMRSSFIEPIPPRVGDVGAIVDVVDDGRGGIGYVVESIVEEGEYKGSTRWVALFSVWELRASSDLRHVLCRTAEA